MVVSDVHDGFADHTEGDDTPTISSGVERLRQVIEEGQAVSAQPSSSYARAANGSLPVVVYTVNEARHLSPRVVFRRVADHTAG